MNSKIYKKISSRINYDKLDPSLFSFSPLDGRYKKNPDVKHFLSELSKSQIKRNNSDSFSNSYSSIIQCFDNSFISTNELFQSNNGKFLIFNEEELKKCNNTKEFNFVFNSTSAIISKLNLELNSIKSKNRLVDLENQLNKYNSIDKQKLNSKDEIDLININSEIELSYINIFNSFIMFNSTLLKFCKEMWYFISLGLFVQKAKAGEIGSSTMPHKINPIDFENAEGNYGIANGYLNAFIEMKTNKKCYDNFITIEIDNNLKNCLGYMCLANSSLIKGMNKLSKNNNL